LSFYLFDGFSSGANAIMDPKRLFIILLSKPEIIKRVFDELGLSNLFAHH
jgi:hypothetical protein